MASASYQYTTGRLTAKQYGNGDLVTYAYDLESRLTNLTIWAGTMLQRFGYTYDAMGMMRSLRSESLLGVSNAVQTIDYGYDTVYQLTSEVVRVNNGAGVTNGWSYDAAGNVHTASGPFGQATATVNADNELTAWTQGVQQLTVTGQVDPGPNNNKWFGSTASAQGHSAPVSMQDGSFGIVGVPVNSGENLLTAIVQDVSGNTATNIVNFTVGSSQSSTFGYDANGNLSSVSSASSVVNYSYDAENRLTTVTSNGVAVLECWYDGAGRRIAKREVIGGQTNTVQYVWDGWNLIAVLGEDGRLQEFYTRGVGIAGDIGTLVAATHYAGGSPSATYYLHNNHRGDVILARQGTNTVATLDYTPYGEVRSQSGSYAPRFRFSSKEYDAGTGFYYFPYRYYSPQWARWMTRDLLKNTEINGEPSLYAYAFNDPIKFVDPLGRDGCTTKIEPLGKPILISEDKITKVLWLSIDAEYAPETNECICTCNEYEVTDIIRDYKQQFRMTTHCEFTIGTCPPSHISTDEIKEYWVLMSEHTHKSKYLGTKKIETGSPGETFCGWMCAGLCGSLPL